MNRLTIAIDGPAGAGKSTVSKVLARKLSYLYIDTGAMYRAVTYTALKRGIIEDKKAIAQMVQDLRLTMEPTEEAFRIYVNGEEVTQYIRSAEVNDNVSEVATIKEVRQFLVKAQRELASKGGAILDGRDIGSVVLPNADVKFYLMASVKARATRRYKEMIEKGMTTTLEEVEKNVEHRDYLDSNREESPLTQVEDAIVIDSSDMTFEETVDAMYDIIKNKALHI